MSGTPDAIHLQRVPLAEAIRESLAVTLGRKVKVSHAVFTPPEGAVPVAVGAYVDDSDSLICCCWVDLALGSTLGAAMSMVPRASAEECLTTGVLPTEFRENLHEVLNIASALLNEGEVAHVRIRALEMLETGLSEDVLGLLADPRTGGFYTVEVEDYGTGLMSFTLA
jgi:hypothetical protein